MRPSFLILKAHGKESPLDSESLSQFFFDMDNLIFLVPEWCTHKLENQTVSL